MPGIQNLPGQIGNRRCTGGRSSANCGQANQDGKVGQKITGRAQKAEEIGAGARQPARA